MMDQRPFALGRRVLRHAVLALVATAIVPPIVARGLNDQRQAHTRRILQQGGQSLVDLLSVSEQRRLSVTCGDGRLPDIDLPTATDRGLARHWVTHEAWMSRLESSDRIREGILAADAWDRCVLVRTGGGLTSVLLSAGANGLVETAIDSTTGGGDDLVLVLASPTR